MNRHRNLALLLTMLLSTWAASVNAGNLYSSNYFDIELPEGYSLAPQTNEMVFKFKDDGPDIIIMVNAGIKDPEALHKNAMDVLNGALPGAKPGGDKEQTMIMHGNPARFRIYSTLMDISGQKIPLFAFLGEVVLDSGGIVCLVIMNQFQQDKIPMMANAFASIQ